MISVTSHSPTSPMNPVYVGQVTPVVREPVHGQLSAAEAGALRGSSAVSNSELRNGSRPELRSPLRTPVRPPSRDDRVEQSGEGIGVPQAIQLPMLLANLMAMILKLELGDSKMIINSSRRETALAASQARTMIESGRTSMASGISKAAAMGLATFAGAGLSMRGLSRQIGAVKRNFPRAAELGNYGAGVGKKAHVDVTDKTSADISVMRTHDDVIILKSSRTQLVGSAVQQVSVMSGAAIDGSSSAITSSLGATRETLSGEASVQGRQTDIDIKARARNESLKEQTFANIRGIIQNQLDVMAHVAQNTRV